MYSCWKDYIVDGMFKIKIILLFYKLCDFNIWHAILFHMNKRLTLSNLDFIPKLYVRYSCSHAKRTKSSHKSVFRELEPLDLINPDICELHGTFTINDKRYFIIFIDDCNFEK